MKPIPKRVSSVEFRKNGYSRRQVEMMFRMDDGSLDDELASRLWGARYRIIMHPLVEAEVVSSSWFGGSKIYYQITADGLDDLQILRDRFGTSDEEA